VPRRPRRLPPENTCSWRSPPVRRSARSDRSSRPRKPLGGPCSPPGTHASRLPLSQPATFSHPRPARGHRYLEGGCPGLAPGPSLDLRAGRARRVRPWHQRAVDPDAHPAAPLLPQPRTLAFPENRDAPIAATLDFSDVKGIPIRAEFDFLQTGPQTWDIAVETGGGRLVLSSGGARLMLDERVLVDEKEPNMPPSTGTSSIWLGEAPPMSISPRWSMWRTPSC